MFHQTGFQTGVRVQYDASRQYTIFRPRNGSSYLKVQQRRGEKQYYFAEHGSTVVIRTDSEEGPIKAACRLDESSKDAAWTLGDPESVGQEFSSLQSEKPRKGGPPYEFHHADKKYEWKPTHNKAVGSSYFAKSDFKLIETARSEWIYAVYIRNPDLRKKDPSSVDALAFLDFYLPLDEEMELIALATALGVVEKAGDSILKEKQSSGIVSVA